MAISHMKPQQETVYNTNVFSAQNKEILLQAMEIRRYEADSFVYEEGDSSNELFYIHSGKVKLAKLSRDGNEHVSALYHHGDLFGMVEPDLDTPYHDSAYVIETSEIGVIGRSELETLLWQHGDLALEFIEWMGYMHRLTQTKFRDLTMYGKMGALCSTIIRLSNSFGIHSDEGIHITMRFTNAELATFIGCTRESVNRMLTELRHANAIVIKRGYITITDLAYLQKTCCCELCPPQLCRI